ncbi:MAG: sugar phosphate isomerase/epimerase, partial [Firmicutes bacterium]|nr:sugar phosphate isomerase/epimerase [Bacillota bacterium]
YLTEDMRPGNEGFIALVSSLPKLGGICNDNGVKLLYHNHGYEFARMPDGRYALDYLFETVAPDLLQTELDTCWIKVMGESPVEYLKKYAGRCPVVHLKDFYLEGSLDGLFRLLGWAGESPNGSRLDVHFEYRPLGFGMQSIPEIINAASEAGAEFLIVEQDDSVGRSALEAVQMSYNYLRTLLN